ncbi:ImmA/IrrE family metallo-endopeptidase [Ornithinibacillus sp. L9]|uniref:ImmA/IrrE family metallo-endopeptidase n=1 Tax=Ornithinibacillus caprae TaxID=2678566 RepID=A0A6N8FL78_9BACI|nr:ImmA/IrrE family metallo-endopeptidase [Ornithinibacillus caprae]MUK89114.1 ImmA/IrrE family metallo-endopeptidase [Ornithinibacillus caprae]
MFTYNRTEDYIQQFLHSIYITEPHQLTIRYITKIIKLPVRFWEFTSEVVYSKGKYIMFLEETAPLQKQWQDFGHELCHVLWHVGRQEYLPNDFLKPQEWQANHFAYHFCVPTFMLEQIRNPNVNEIMYLFNVDRQFATRRLEMYQSKFNYIGGYEYARSY